MSVLIVLIITAPIVYAVFVWLRSKRVDPYDLRRLNAASPDDDPGEAYDDMVTDDSEPYCHGCDQPNPAGVRVCLSCGRPL